MDLQKTIEELYAEKEKLERVIESLELLQGTSVPLGTVSRRGRKSMDLKERQQVSERMKRYWASQRAARAAGVGS
jgi:hypothetical protein